MSDLAPAPPWHDATEALVADVWRQILGGKVVNRSSSLLAMRVGLLHVNRFAAEIETRSGVALPISTIVQAHTIPAIADIIRSGRLPDFTPVIAFKIISPDEAPGLFIFPGLGGSALQVLDLARLIDTPGGIYLNQPAGLDGRQPPHASLAEMIRFQVEAIRAMQPKGPYLLLGYSLGANIAFEVARQLCLDGEQVPFLGLIEAILPERDWPLRASIRFLFQRLRVHGRSLRSLSVRDSGGYVLGRTKHLVGRIGRMFARQGGGWLPYRDAGLPRPIEALRAATLQAFDHYRLRSYDGPVTLFHPEAIEPLACDPLLVWPRFLADYTVRTTPGAHTTMISGRNAAFLASEVSACVRAVTRCFPHPPSSPCQ